MIVLAIAGFERGAEVIADVMKNRLQVLNSGVIQYAASVFGHKDQMHMKCANDMSSGAIFHLETSQAKTHILHMETIRGFIYTLRPTQEQKSLLAQTAGVTRLVYNLALEQRRTWGGRPYGGGTSRNFRYQGMSGELSALRKAFDWIGAVSQTAQIQSLIDLDRAYTNFFEGRAKYPRPRKKGLNDSFRHVGREIKTRRLNGKWSEVKIPKIGWVLYRDTRSLPTGGNQAPDIRNATLRRRGDGAWEISIAVRYEFEAQDTPAACVGIDRGVAIPFALSTGAVTYLPDTIARREKRIRRARKVLSRRKRGSKRYAQARRRLSKMTLQNARARNHTAHALTRRLASCFGMVAIEDLKIKNMTASARGTIEEPGSRVAQKAGLNRAILNVGWHSFEQKLGYKMEEFGGLIIKVDPRNTSRTCSGCGHVDAKSRKNQAAFVCTACGIGHNADVNAARNILARALARNEDRRWNTPLLDVEGKALAPAEASTHNPANGFNGHVTDMEIPVSSGRGRC